jgi:hypothetical protein
MPSTPQGRRRAPSPQAELTTGLGNALPFVEDTIHRGLLLRASALSQPPKFLTKAYWFAGIVTPGVGPLTPVSAIENSSMMVPNVYFD